MPSIQTRIWLGLSALSLTLLVAGYWIGERQGLLIGLLCAFALLGLSYHYSEKHWVDALDAVQLEGQDPWGVVKWASEIAAKAKIQAPKLFLIESSFPTAFSQGRHANSAHIILTRGLLSNFSETEIRAVLSHEISKIRRGDHFRFGVMAGLASPLLLLTDGLDTLIWLVSLGKGKRVLRRVLLPVYALLFRIVFQKADQYETDRFAAHLLRDPELLARVLMKLQSYSVRQTADFPPTAAESMIVNPLTAQSSNRYFKSQPTVEDRVEKLVGRYPV